MEEKKYIKPSENGIELRSEKVRNIIGQIPTKLIRHGIMIIFMALLVIMSTGALIPYRKVVGGIAIIHEVPVYDTDSLFIHAELKFINTNRIMDLINNKIILMAPSVIIEGRVVDYQPKRNTHGYSRAKLIVASHNVELLEDSEIDFKLIHSDTNVLKYIVKSMFKIHY